MNFRAYIFVCEDYSETIAPIGQASAHVPQSMHTLGSIL